MQPLQFADSRNVQIGDPAIAIGNPFGLDRTATEGIVSGLGRHIQAPNGFEIDSVIQTDAPINPGNSGGPLLDSSAHVIGVNSQIATAGSARQRGHRLRGPVEHGPPGGSAGSSSGETVRHAYLGLSTLADNAPRSERRAGRNVVPGGPADNAGMQQGDVIIKVGSTQIVDSSDVSAAIAGRQPGEQIDVQVATGWGHRDPPRQARQPAADAVTFAAPLVLLALVALPLLGLAYLSQQRARRAAAASFSSPALQPAVAPRRPGCSPPPADARLPARDRRADPGRRAAPAHDRGARGAGVDHARQRRFRAR